MNNGDIYNILNYFANKEQSGNTFNKDEYQDMLNNGSLKLLKKRLGMPEEYQLQTAYTQQGYANTTRILVDLASFVTISNITYSSGSANTPTDMAYPISLEYERASTECAGEMESINVEMVNRGELIMRKSSALKPISYEYPVYTLESGINIYPKTIPTSEFTYIKYPTQAVIVFDTNEETGEEEYNASASTELEWNDLAKLDIISIILAGIGLNLGSSEIIQVAESYKTKGI